MEALKPISERDVAAKFRGAIESTQEVVTTRLNLWEEQAKTVWHLALTTLPWLITVQSLVTSFLVVAALTLQILLLELVGQTASWVIAAGVLFLLSGLAIRRVQKLYSEIKHALKPEEAI